MKLSDRHAVTYVGDPMCSWCWGIYPALKTLQAYCSEEGIPFEIIVGGLRPQGGDAWDDKFKTFLRIHWERIGKSTGQPFGFKLLDKKHFDYTTEPPCRAVVAARGLLLGQTDNNSKLYAFFAAIQRKFYVDGKDTGKVEFYRDICNIIDLNFEAFSASFNSDMTKEKTQKDFALSRSWGVQSYPSILFQDGTKQTIIASGYVTPEEILTLVQSSLAQ